MHNTHLFDKTNPNDIETLNIWLEKSKTCKGYKSAIQIWTKSDIDKYNIAMQNHLNYKILYNEQDVVDFFIELELI